jgi:hypothetical protein
MDILAALLWFDCLAVVTTRVKEFVIIGHLLFYRAFHQPPTLSKSFIQEDVHSRATTSLTRRTPATAHYGASGYQPLGERR